MQSSYYKDFWTDELDITEKDLRASDKDRLQLVYLELAKLVFLPFLYGYGWTSVLGTPVHDKISFDLKLVSEKKIFTSSDISDIVDAVIQMSNSFTNPEISDSRYMQSRIDEYVKLSQAKSDVMIARKEQVFRELTSFK